MEYACLSAISAWLSIGDLDSAFLATRDTNSIKEFAKLQYLILTPIVEKWQRKDANTVIPIISLMKMAYVKS